MKTAILLCILLSVLGTLPANVGCWGAEYYSEGTICVHSPMSKECSIGSLKWSVNSTCSSLQCVSEKLRERTNLAILFEVGNFPLETLLLVNDSNNVAFIGCPDQSIINCSSKNAGLAFHGVKNLTLVGLTLMFCGAVQNSTSMNITTNNTTAFFRSSIYVWDCTDVNIESVSIKNSSGNALTFIDTGGRVRVSELHAEWNAVPELESEVYPGGGGVYVEFTQCPPGSLECPYHSNQHKNSNYTFQKCNFSKNHARNLDPEKTSFTDSSGSNFQGLGRGGGLCIIFRGTATNNSFQILESYFSGNSAIWGGGLYVSFQDASEQNSVTVRNTSFEQNSACERGGGGASVGHLFFKGQTPHQKNRIEFYNCTFFKNKANYGGGTFIYSSQSNTSYKKLQNIMKFEGCKWLENMARYGSAMDISPHSWDTLSYGFLPIPEFEDCHFESNMVVHNYSKPYKEYKIGRGALLVSSFYIRFRGNISFKSNNGTAMYLTSSIIDFATETNAIFSNNIGLEGGAITLIGFSSLYVNDRSTFNFVNNTAINRGGAIYSLSIDKHDYVSSRSCFIQYKGHATAEEQKNIIFKFSGNRVNVSDTAPRNNYGQSIFATSLKPCMYACSEELASKLFSCIGNFTYGDQLAEDVISSSGRSFNLDKSQTLPLQVTPGKEFELPINITDDFQHKVRTVYYTTVSNDEGSNITTDEAYSYLYDRRMMLFGEPNSTGRLNLFKTGFREIAISLEIKLLECPPGYVLHEQVLKKCVCARETDYSYPGLIKCDNTLFQAYFKRGYWVGYGDSETAEGLLSARCPSKFCSYNRSRAVSNVLPGNASRETLDHHVCGPTRTGTLCAKCSGNHSIYYHSTYLQCGKNTYCKIGWLFYILSELLPLTVLFVTVIIFNISFTSGATNGFIFFSQVIDSLSLTAGDFIRLPSGLHLLTETAHFIYRFFNFDFFDIKGLSFCLWENATTLDVLAFKYFTVVYALILVILTVTIMNVCNCYRICSCLTPRTVKSSVIHGLSAFLVMCYVQCAKVSFHLLTPTILYSQGYNKSRIVVYRHGETGYFSRDHLPYAIPAIFCLIVIVFLPPILLLIYPAHYKVLAVFKLNESQKLQQISRWISFAKLKPLFDSLQSCYKDNCRFFAGLYFMYRLFIIIANGFTRSYVGFYTIIQVILMFMFILHALAQPYRKLWHNTVDTFIIAALNIINGLTLFNYATLLHDGWIRNEFDTTVDMTLYFQVLLIYLPMIYMAVYVLVQLAPKMLHFLFPKINLQKKQESVPLNDTEFPARLIHEDDTTDSDCSGELATEYEAFEENTN